MADDSTWYCQFMVGAKTLDCASCGGPLEIEPGRSVIECSYCGRALSIEQGRTRTTREISPTVSDGLLRGYDGEDCGRGVRHDVAAMKERDWPCYERGVWPVAGRSSSRYGNSWGDEAVRGAPRVYPRHGDRPGAWAPRRRTSHTEWLEALYPADAGPVQAIRVFETCAAGSTFAVTLRNPDGDELLLWKQRPKAPMSGAQVLEIPLETPERVASVRVYVTNDQATWTQIDTIGLVAVEPIAPHLRQHPPPPPATSHLVSVIVALVVLAMLGVGAGVYLMAARNAPDKSSDQTDGVTAPPVTLSDSVMAPWPVQRDALLAADIRWARAGLQASSEYRVDRWSRRQLVGPPDVFPAHADHERAWATARPDDGVHWASVAFAGDVQAGAVVLVETFHPGAVMRVDDISQPDAPIALWRGTVASADHSRVLRLTLPTPRRITRLRVLLDTDRAPGWNEIDAVGLLPATP